MIISCSLALPSSLLDANPKFRFPRTQSNKQPFTKRDCPTIFCKSTHFSSPSPEPFDLQRYWTSTIEEIDGELQKAIPLRYPQILQEAMRYSVLAKDKAASPIICIAACEAVGGSKEQALPTACALHMIHTASQIHHDLPCIDDQPIRRGQPSNHIVFGVDMAVWTADALFPLGFEYIASATSQVPADRVLGVIAHIARAVGSEGIVAGQHTDLGCTGSNKIEPSLVKFIQEHKFGIMEECSATSGGILGGASKEAMERLRNYGRFVGILYQILDNIHEEEAILQGNVEARRKIKPNYARAHGLEKAQQAAKKLRANAKVELLGFDRKKVAPLYSFVDYAFDRKFSNVEILMNM